MLPSTHPAQISQTTRTEKINKPDVIQIAFERVKTQRGMVRNPRMLFVMETRRLGGPRDMRYREGPDESRTDTRAGTVEVTKVTEKHKFKVSMRSKLN